MPQLIVTADTLNFYTTIPVSPDDNSGLVGMVFRGKIINADLDPASVNWYKDANGFFYSGVALEESINYNSLMGGISAEWKNTNGRGINVAILDTGCFDHSALNNSIVASYNAVAKTTDVTDVSDNSHGTFIAGLIAARNNTSLTGVAPEVNLIIVKVANNEIGVVGTDVLEGLNWLNTQCPVKPDIVNISLDFDPFPDGDTFKQLFAAMYDNNIITFAAGQNDANLITTHIFYPAAETNVIGVGALAAGSLNTDDYKNINTLIKYIIPDIDYYSTGNSGTFTINNGCSFSTAITSGVFALLFSFLKPGNSLTDIITLFEKSTNFLDRQFNNGLKISKNENQNTTAAINT